MFYKAAAVRLRTEVAGQAPREDLGIYHHFTVAIDTDNIKKVFDAVKDMANGSQFFFDFSIFPINPNAVGISNFKE